MSANLEQFVELTAHDGGEGVVWLDSSGCSAGEREPVSRMFWAPVEILQGSVFSDGDRERLRRVLAGLPQASGALAGAVDYDGSFTFGVYPEHQVGPSLEASHEEAPQEASGPPMHPEMTRDSFCGAVSAAKEYIAAGDIYQVNIAQRFSGPGIGRDEAVALYRRLRVLSPVPRGAFVSLNGRQLLSASPETFIDVRDGKVTTRPIKGTRPRCTGAVEDARSIAELQGSAKERSELVMITDLERNDLGRVCEFGSVEVSDLIELESFEHVHHLVSTVRGDLLPEKDALDVLAECSPGGSITGAPKRRAMEIIEELEPCQRGAYTGSIGYLGADGSASFNIAIRTIVATADEMSFHVGSGIVADSDPVAEYEETLHKGKGMALALGLDWEV